MTATINAQSSATDSASAQDEPYRFGRRPTVRAPFPFSERQFARLLILRGRLHDAPLAADQASV